MTRSFIGDPVADVSIAVGIDERSMAVEKSVRYLNGLIYCPEVVVRTMRGEIARVIVVEKVVKVADRICMFALGDESGRSVRKLSVIVFAMHEIGIYSLFRGRSAMGDQNTPITEIEIVKSARRPDSITLR